MKHLQKNESGQAAVRRRRMAAPLYDWISAMIVALIVLVVFFSAVFRVVGVDGDSMVPTLQDGDRLVLFCMTDHYSAGDIVVIDRYTREPLIKRVIAVAGDTVYIDADNALYINDELQQEPYIQGVNVPRDMKGRVTVPNGCLFVMGDNRSVSMDSRMQDVGMVSVKDVVGRAVFRLWPLRSVGGIYGNLDYVRIKESD